MTKLLQSDWLRGVQFLNDFRDGWGEWEIKTTKSNMAAKFN